MWTWPEIVLEEYRRTLPARQKQCRPCLRGVSRVWRAWPVLWGRSKQIDSGQAFGEH